MAEIALAGAKPFSLGRFLLPRVGGALASLRRRSPLLVERQRADIPL